jgi:hypothetical protein
MTKAAFDSIAEGLTEALDAVRSGVFDHPIDFEIDGHKVRLLRICSSGTATADQVLQEAMGSIRRRLAGEVVDVPPRTGLPKVNVRDLVRRYDYSPSGAS